MFFDDEDDLPLRKSVRLKAPPPIPETGWRPPQEFPNLTNAVVISLDVETRETDFKHGPGWARGKGHIVGFSLGAIDRRGNRGKWYFPLRHEIEPDWNLDPAKCLAWLRTVMATPHIPKVGANLLYDIGWLGEEGVEVQGELHDVQFAEALLDEQGEVALEYLGGKYLGEGKETAELYAWLAAAYGGEANSRQRANIYQAPPRLVGPYAESDADLPLRVLERQWQCLLAEGLTELYRMECDLIPLLIDMRRAGVSIDVPAAEQLFVELGHDITRLKADLFGKTGVHANTNSGDDLAKVFDAAGIEYPRTAGGKPSFRKEFLKGLEHPIADLINEIREHEKIQGTFVKSYLLESNINGKVYCQFHPLRGDEGGTKTGRFSSSDPNLQNIPVRTKLGKKVRKAFIPDAGHIHWKKYDYSQIEYRMLAHFAVDGDDNNIGRIIDFWQDRLGVWGIEGFADNLRATYVADPKTDYHDVVQRNVKDITGLLIDRKPIKNINFGLLYGQSEKGLSFKAGFTPEQAKNIFTAYHQGAPYVKPTMAAVGQEVQTFGFVRTILGRRTRFNMWEPARRGERGLPMRYDAALRQYGQFIRRAFEYRGVNYKLQGSAADVMKRAMLAAYKSGVFNQLGVPRLTVHDELDFSVQDDTSMTREAWNYLTHTLENSTPLRIPVRVDHGTGPNWGAIE
jgi:DNA polymerase-1